MEYMAALEGLRSLPAGSRVCIVTDSRLMLDSMTKWIAGWQRRGWKTATGGSVKNQDLLRALDAELARHDARWHWVRGHETGAAHAHKALNDRADRLAVAAAAAAAAAGRAAA
jgi:ribonuclease HI